MIVMRSVGVVMKVIKMMIVMMMNLFYEFGGVVIKFVKNLIIKMSSL